MPRPTSAAEARAQRVSADRRPPDSRFVHALAELAPAGAENAPVEATFRDGNWDLTRAGKTLASVPEYPGFAALFDAVAGPAPAGNDAPERPLLLGEAAQDEMAKVDAEWMKGSRDPLLLSRAAHVLVSMAFELDDEVGLADDLYTRAIAAAGRARAAGALARGDEALLASALGYEREAQELAKALPTDSALRMFLLDDDAALQKKSEGSGFSFDHYFWTRRVAERGDAGPSLSLLNSNDPDQRTLPFVFAHLRNDSFDTLATASRLALSASLQAAVGGPTPRSAGEFRGPDVAAAEAALAALPERKGALFNGPVERAVGRARIATALWETTHFRINRGESRESVARRVKEFGFPSTPPWDDLSTCLAGWAAGPGQSRQDPFEALLENGLPSLDAVAVARLLEWEGRPAQPKSIRLSRLLARRTDTRPRHRSTLVSLLPDLSLDFGWEERMKRRLNDVMPSPEVQLQLAVADADFAQLQRMVDDPSVPATTRVTAVRRLFEANKLDIGAAAKRMRALVESAPDDAGAEPTATEFLGQQQRWEDVRFLHDSWLRRHRDERTLAAASIRAKLARALVRLNRPKEALPLLGPALDFGPAVAYEAASIVQFALGHRAEGVAMEQELVDAYPDSKSPGSLMALWYGREYALAAERFRATFHHWEREGPADDFLWVFGTRPLKEARAAIAAIPEPVKNGGFFYFIRRLTERKRPDLAALVVETKRKDATGGRTSLEYVTMYRAQGAAGADRWLGAVAPEKQRDVYTDLPLERAYDVMADPPRTLQNALEFPDAACLQAVAFAWTGVHSGRAFDDARRRATAKADDPAWIPTRVLLGLEPKDALAKTPVGFINSRRFLEAVLLERDGNRAEALESYLDVIDVRGNINDYNYTRMRLQAWVETGKSLKRIFAGAP